MAIWRCLICPKRHGTPGKERVPVTPDGARDGTGTPVADDSRMEAREPRACMTHNLNLGLLE